MTTKTAELTETTDRHEASRDLGRVFGLDDTPLPDPAWVHGAVSRVSRPVTREVVVAKPPASSALPILITGLLGGLSLFAMSRRA